MIKKDLIAEQAVYRGKIRWPKGFEIDNDNIKANIIYAVAIADSRKSKNKHDYKYHDYNFEDCENVDRLKVWLVDHFLGKTFKTLVFKEHFAHAFYPKQHSINKQQANIFDLKESTDHTVMYCVAEGDQQLILEFDAHRYKQRTFVYPMKKEEFLIFPSTTRYYFTENKSDNMTAYLGINYYEL